jgi:hypothetical protein
MTAGTEVLVSAESATSFRVEVRSARGTTTHLVDVPPGLPEDLGWGETDPADLVRESFSFLLEREPPTSILRRFSLEVISQYFPEYPAQIRRRR